MAGGRDSSGYSWGTEPVHRPLLFLACTDFLRSPHTESSRHPTVSSPGAKVQLPCELNKILINNNQSLAFCNILILIGHCTIIDHGLQQSGFLESFLIINEYKPLKTDLM